MPVAGGSCLNVAIGMARLGAPTGFAGGISTDLFGCLIADHAERSQVDLRYATRSAYPTTLAFVRMVNDEPQYAFYDEETASRHWRYRKGSIPFTEIDAIHVGSTTLVNRAGAAEALAMVEDAHGLTTVSFDPNCRPNLVQDKAQYVRRMSEFTARADIVRLSDNDFAFLYGDSEHAAKAKTLLCGGRCALRRYTWHSRCNRLACASRSRRGRGRGRSGSSTRSEQVTASRPGCCLCSGASGA